MGVLSDVGTLLLALLIVTTVMVGISAAISAVVNVATGGEWKLFGYLLLASFILTFVHLGWFWLICKIPRVNGSCKRLLNVTST